MLQQHSCIPIEIRLARIKRVDAGMTMGESVPSIWQSLNGATCSLGLLMLSA
jgi:hypothetical protein